MQCDNLPAALGPGVYSASNRNDTRSRKIKLLARPVGLSRLSNNVGSVYLTPLEASTICYEDGFLFYLYSVTIVTSLAVN
jgi:hypothetical protein